jgi:seryl-tRNA synthetase
MTIDIALFRNPDTLAQIREAQKRRCKKQEDIDAVIAADNKAREAKYAVDNLRGSRNKIQEEITEKKKKKEEVSQELLAKKKEADEKLPQLEVEAKQAEAELATRLRGIGNFVHDSVPVSDNEDDNVTHKTWGKIEAKAGLLHHAQLLYKIDGYDAERGVGVAGHRAYFLKGNGVRLNQAIIQYGLDFLHKRGYTLLQTPFFMEKPVMAKTAQLEQFDEELYKVIGGAKDESDEKYLIATSEQPISAFHQNEWLDPSSLPYKYGGISTCFRKEAGAHGKDVRGIFRVHQFEKVEQFVITAPEKSWEMHEEMLATSEAFFQSLGIPYRVVLIVSGALNNAAAKKYDLEGWFPGFSDTDEKTGKVTLGNFRELVSCSNCTDYQSRDLEIRYGAKKEGEAKKYVHMLNSTLCATTRTICAILENYQTEEGIRVPDVLIPFMGGQTLIPFVHKDLPKEVAPKTAAKKGGKQ